MKVNVDNFARAETAAQFDRMVARAGGVNEFAHARVPTPLDKQDVIRMNRDTLYSFAVIDTSGGAAVEVPDAGDRYLSVMVVSLDHHVTRVIHTPGVHQLSDAAGEGDWVVAAARVLADPDDPEDLAEAHLLQDGLGVRAASSRDWSHPDYDEDSLAETRDLLLALARGVSDTHGMFGAPGEVDPVRHLLGTAFGWGGLPESEAFYVTQAETMAVGDYTLTVGEVPVDAFWSITVYNRDGFLDENPYGAYSLNSVTARRGADGTVTVRLAPEPADDAPNYLHVMDGWNYAVRLYRPRPEILSGAWRFPTPVPD